MFTLSSRRLMLLCISAYVCAIGLWTLLFFRSPLIRDVLPDIHLIFTGTLAAYLVIKIFLSEKLMDFLKLYFRIFFRVWLIIFLTLMIRQSMGHAGSLLSVTYIFGYIEGLFEIDKWLRSGNLLNKTIFSSKLNKKQYEAMTCIVVMSLVHMSFALLLKLVEGWLGN